MHILSAQQFIAQSTTPGQIASIARFLASADYGHEPQPELAAAVRKVAEEVAAITGVRLYGKRGYYVPPRPPRPRRAANDNRGQRSGERGGERRRRVG